MYKVHAVCAGSLNSDSLASKLALWTLVTTGGAALSPPSVQDWLEQPLLGHASRASRHPAGVPPFRMPGDHAAAPHQDFAQNKNDNHALFPTWRSALQWSCHFLLRKAPLGLFNKIKHLKHWNWMRFVFWPSGITTCPDQMYISGAFLVLLLALCHLADSNEIYHTHGLLLLSFFNPATSFLLLCLNLIGCVIFLLLTRWIPAAQCPIPSLLYLYWPTSMLTFYSSAVYKAPSELCTAVVAVLSDGTNAFKVILQVVGWINFWCRNLYELFNAS